MTRPLNGGDDLIGILLVDDDPDCLLFVREAIEEANFANPVYEVTSGQEALGFLFRRGEHADAPPVGLVYLDIEMPGMSGQEVLKAIRADERFDGLPVVMMTALSSSREKAEAARNGANSYTVKPMDPVAFMRTVIEATRYWIGMHQRPDEVLWPEGSASGDEARGEGPRTGRTGPSLGKERKGENDGKHEGRESAGD